MPLDAICLQAVVEELRPQLLNLRIDKVQQPARDQVILLLSLHKRTARRGFHPGAFPCLTGVTNGRSCGIILLKSQTTSGRTLWITILTSN